MEAPKWATALVYVAVGWIGALGFPGIVGNAGLGAGALIAVGGVFYTAGAVIYARQRPDPNPAVFGYHEIFHLAGDRRRRGPLRRRGDLRACPAAEGPQPGREAAAWLSLAASIRAMSSCSRSSRTSSTGSGSPLTIPSKNSLRS